MSCGCIWSLEAWVYWLDKLTVPHKINPIFVGFFLPDTINVSRQHGLSKGSVFANPKTVVNVTQWWQKYNNAYKHQLFPVVLCGLNTKPDDLRVLSDSLTYASKRFSLIHLKLLSSEEWIQEVNKASWVLDHNTRFELRQRVVCVSCCPTSFSKSILNSISICTNIVIFFLFN